MDGGPVVSLEPEDELDAEDRIYTTLGMCGCGIPDEVTVWVCRLLELIAARFGPDSGDYWGNEEEKAKAKAAYDAIGDHFKASHQDAIAEYCIWYWLDSRGLLEHGGSIGGSWLSDKGKKLLAQIQAKE